MSAAAGTTPVPSSNTFLETCRNTMNQIQSMQTYYRSNPNMFSSHSGGSTIPNFETLSSELNNLWQWANQNPDLLNQILSSSSGSGSSTTHHTQNTQRS